MLSLTTSDLTLLRTDRRFLYADPAIPIVRAALASQRGSTWPEIPVKSLTSWNGWQHVPAGIQYPAMTSDGGPAKYSRHEWRCLPDRDKDDFYLVGAATYNGIQANSTFATPAVMRGYLRIIKSVCGVSL